jgi:hypothetical protein
MNDAGLDTIMELLERMPSPSQADEVTAFVRASLPRFVDALAQMPLPPGAGSMSTAEAFWTFCLARELKPAKIIDSGSATGWSAHLMALAVPSARIACYDPYCEPDSLPANATFAATDWYKARNDRTTVGPTLALFDDHVNQGLRARQARRSGITDALFHDVYPVLNKSLVSVRFVDLVGIAESCHTFEPLWHVDPIFRDLTISSQLYRWLTWVRLDHGKSIGRRLSLTSVQQRRRARNPLAKESSRRNWRARG